MLAAPLRRYAPMIPVLKAGLALAGSLYVLGVVLGLLPYGHFTERIEWAGEAWDLAAYWSADPSDPYTGILADRLAYLYSPAFIEVFAPLQLLPFAVVKGLWLAGQFAALWWMRALWLIPLPFVYDDMIRGNIGIFLGLAAVLGMRWAGAWAFPLLTKVTPGVGLVWFAVRREWKTLATAGVVTLAIVAVSALFVPGQWIEWTSILTSSSDRIPRWNMLPFPVLYRLPFAVAIVAFGAWKGWAWTVPVGMLVAMPSAWQSAGAVLAAIPRIGESEPRPPPNPLSN